MRPRSHARRRTLASTCAAPNSRTDLVVRSELDLSPRVAGRRARTRWPLRATLDVRWRSLVGTRDRVACAQVLPGACVRFRLQDAALPPSRVAARCRGKGAGSCGFLAAASKRQVISARNARRRTGRWSSDEAVPMYRRNTLAPAQYSHLYTHHETLRCTLRHVNCPS